MPFTELIKKATIMREKIFPILSTEGYPFTSHIILQKKKTFKKRDGSYRRSFSGALISREIEVFKGKH